MKSLPAEPYEFCEWRIRRVGIDYHVEIAAHYYSVPHRFARAESEAIHDSFIRNAHRIELSGKSLRRGKGGPANKA